MKEFTYNALPGRILFGAGKIQKLADEIDRLGCSRVLVLTTPEQKGQGEMVKQLIGDRWTATFSQATMHVPTEVVEQALEVAQKANADCVVGIGGGSTTGLGKALALRSELPIVAIPTTYAGSEMTPIWGLTENGIKKTGRDPRVLPTSVVYDPDLTMSLPAFISGPSGVNAIAHCVEALYAPDANPITSLIAEEGRGAILWIGHFVHGDLVAKMAFDRAGLAVNHLSHPRHGFSSSRFGMNCLNRVKTAAEDRHLASRVLLDDSRPTAAMKTLRRCLKHNGVVSISVRGADRNSQSVRCLDGEISIARGAARLARATGAALLPVFPVRNGDGGFTVHVEAPLDLENAEAGYAGRLEHHILAYPGQWLGWFHL